MSQIRATSPRSPRPCFGDNLSPTQYSKPPLHLIPFEELQLSRSAALDSTNQARCTKVEPNGCRPSSRTGHSAVLHEQQMLVFAGEGDSAINNDLHTLLLPIDDDEDYVWEKLLPEGYIPCPRFGHSAILNGDEMIVFGGGGLLNTLDDLWLYSIMENYWEILEDAGERPSPRKYHSVALSNNEMFIYGGDESSLGNSRAGPVETDVFALNLDTLLWRRIETTMDAQVGGWVPHPLTRHSTVCHEEQIFMFGGFVSISRTTDLQVLRVTQKGNVYIQRLTYAGRPPSTRSDHSAVVHRGHMYVYGGEGDSTRWGDCYELNLNTMVWRTIQLTGDLPPECSGHSAIMFKGKMLLFGGIAGESFVTANRHSEVYALTLDEITKTTPN
eukprot:NODE_1846_length_1359_cov_22.336851_g1754_i0.p1 GENE.NODE_1846_length_1359_cov_22.336851_g1754_i0~~NODE_1846_length_1359_cov_22.336851_g1754_i0.p1  ORF type:complete len:392 (+),score=99.64 NODE_1846_length_1359_cov_22.336851_g1754_i0:22-1176(+)